MGCKFFFLPLFLLSHLAVLAQQDAQFGQYLFNGLHINPAYAGYKEELYLQAFARAQWIGVRGAPQTLSISADEAIKDESIGLGLIIGKDKIGAQRSLIATGNLAYRIKLDRTETNVLAFGIGLGVKQLGLDGNLLDPHDLGDNRIPTGNVSQITPEFRAGIFYSNEKYFAGFSATNLIARSIAILSDYNTLSITPQTHLYLTAGMLLPINDYILFRPTFLLKDDIRGPTSLDLNTFFLFNERFWIGSAYRSSVKLYPKNNLQKNLPNASTVGIITEYFTKSNLRIGYGYDFTLNKLQRYDYGSHEISLGYYFTTKKSRRPKCYF
ncbi:PorP/SprF family type IX secretion system membrane protein [Pedobacter sp. UBA5917]|uniref:PorP/SprF family type IX secretion system membrane protein n=1 Tax=Pedobacter sp. UBA5917 TaxID=1947061 RepID=UPI0025D5240D|nr:type IX secretion system membrane protein PorP/SprF [Pedobacter sp. UBA5917]